MDIILKNVFFCMVICSVLLAAGYCAGKSVPPGNRHTVVISENKNMARFVTMTAYTKKKGEITASGEKVRAGAVAVSRDLFDQGFVFGKKVYIHGLGLYEITDLMHDRHTNKIDLFVGTEKEAKTFGVTEAKISLLEV